MLKAAGCILIITATTLAGEKKAADLKLQYLRLKELRQIFFLLQSEIRYARTCLEEIFFSLGRQAKDPSREWLFVLGRRLKKRENGRFEKVWTESIEETLKASGLPEKEIQRLEEMGSQLGIADVEMQVKALELYLTQLSESMEDIREEIKTKVRLYHCLGVMSGMLIVILLM